MSGEYVLLVEYGEAAVHHELEIDGHWVLHHESAWLPRFADICIPLSAGKHRVRILGAASQPVLSWRSVGLMRFRSESATVLDYVVFTGLSANQVVSAFHDVTGKPPLLPRAAYDFWPSKKDEPVYQSKHTRKHAAKIGLRPYFLTPSSGAGRQRLSPVFCSEEIPADWEALRRAIAAGVNCSASGIAYWTSAIGESYWPARGYDDSEFRELLVRWFQFGVFNPVFRIPGCCSETELRRYGDEVERTIRRVIELRSRLLPYIYSVAWQVTSLGAMLVRPLAMDDRADPVAMTGRPEFLFGPALLIIPVAEPGTAEVQVRLPEISDWFNFWTGHREAGGRCITVEAPLERVPLFVRVGSIVPLQTGLNATETAAPSIELRIYPGSDGAFDLYEDEGEGLGYESGQRAIVPIRWADATRTVTIGERQGTFPGIASIRVFHLVCVREGYGTGVGPTQTPDAVVTYSGVPVSVQIGMEARSSTEEALQAAPPERVSLREIASQLGITHATVCRALQNNPRISEATRARVHEAAFKMGYHPDPMLVALQHYRKGKRKTPVAAALAWLNGWQKPEQLRRLREFDLYWKGALAAAEKRGYRLEEFRVGPQCPLRRVERILKARGIQGVLLPPHRWDCRVDWRDFDWSFFSGVRFGQSIDLGLHSVTADQVANTMHALEEMRKRGYRRVAFAGGNDAIRLFGAGFLWAQQRLPRQQQVPVFLCASNVVDSEADRLLAWMAKVKPEAIYCDAPRIPEILVAAGYKIPEDIAIAETSVVRLETDREPFIHAGVDQNCEEIGRTAVLMAVSLIMDNSRGIPPIFRRVLVSGKWVDGSNLPVRTCR